MGSQGGPQMEERDRKSQQSGKPSPGKTGSSSGNSSGKSSSSASKENLADRQEKAAEAADRLRKKIHGDEGLTDLARQRMDEAADSIHRSAGSMKDGKAAEAGRQAGEAAEQLERLSRQVAALKAPDISSRLAQGQNLARQLAGQQQQMGKQLQQQGAGNKPGEGQKQAGSQRGSAEEARTLQDLLERLQQETGGSGNHLGEALRQASEANPPAAIVAQLRRSADLLQAGQAPRAQREVEQSARMLAGLAQQLEDAHQGLVQPQLARLIAAEKQAAQTRQALDKVNTDRQKAEAEKKVAQLRDSLEALKPADAKLAEATAALADAVRNGGGGWQHRDRAPPFDGAYIPPIEYTDNVQKVIKVLQTKIQEIILKDTQLDRDEPVPPQYKALVEEYYRVLAEDLR
jgi:hypothetical protein